MQVHARLAAFDRARHALLDQLGAVDEASLMAHPLPGKWSILEIVDHLVMGERAVFLGLPDPATLAPRPRRAADPLRYALVLTVLKSGIRVKVPSPTMLPQGNRTLTELRTLWDENQRWLRSAIEHLGTDGERGAVFDHPVAGAMTIPQALRMAQIHLAGHTRQVEERLRLLTPRV